MFTSSVQWERIQSIYLTELPGPLAETLMGLIGYEIAPIAVAAQGVRPVSADDLDFWERKLEQQLIDDPKSGKLTGWHSSVLRKVKAYSKKGSVRSNQNAALPA
jgi:hypothetical protein